MRCETIEVDRNGKNVIINLSDFNSVTMIKWDESSAAPAVVSAPGSPPPPVLAVAKKLID